MRIRDKFIWSPVKFTPYIVGMCSLVYNLVWYLPLILNKFKREKHDSFAYEFSTLVITNIMLCGKNKRWGQKSKHQSTTFKGQRIPCPDHPPNMFRSLGVKNFCFICLLTLTNCTFKIVKLTNKYCNEKIHAVYFDTSSARIWSPCTERNDKAKQKNMHGSKS